MSADVWNHSRLTEKLFLCLEKKKKDQRCQDGSDARQGHRSHAPATEQLLLCSALTLTVAPLPQPWSFTKTCTTWP